MTNETLESKKKKRKQAFPESQGKKKSELESSDSASSSGSSTNYPVAEMGSFSSSSSIFYSGVNHLFSGSDQYFYTTLSSQYPFFIPYPISFSPLNTRDRRLQVFAELLPSHSSASSYSLGSPDAQLFSSAFTAIQEPRSETSKPKTNLFEELAKALYEKYHPSSDYGEELEVHLLQQLLENKTPVISPPESGYDLTEMGKNIGYLSALSKDQQLQTDPRFSSIISTLFAMPDTPEKYFLNLIEAYNLNSKQQENLRKDARIDLIINQLWFVDLSPQEYVSRLYISFIRYAGRFGTPKETFEKLTSAVQEIDPTFIVPEFLVPIMIEDCNDDGWVVTSSEGFLSYDGSKLEINGIAQKLGSSTDFKRHKWPSMWGGYSPKEWKAFEQDFPSPPSSSSATDEDVLSEKFHSLSFEKNPRFHSFLLFGDLLPGYSLRESPDPESKDKKNEKQDEPATIPQTSLQQTGVSTSTSNDTLIIALISQGFITNLPPRQTQQETQKETQTPPLGPPK